MADSLKEPLLRVEKRSSTPEGVVEKISKGFVDTGGDGNCVYEDDCLGVQARKDVDDVKKSSIVSRALASLGKLYVSLKGSLSSAVLPAKAGLAASICSILCFIPGPLSVLNKNGMWAVITSTFIVEPNVGLTFNQGINRTLGTVAAAVLALGVNYTAPMCGEYEPYFVVFFVFLGGVLATMFKFRRPFKDRWNVAVAISMISFHVLILSQSDYKDKIRLPLIRLVTIIIGFLIGSLVNLSVAPTFAGSTINEMLANNFERAGNVMERCVAAYCKGTVLQQVPDILLGKSEDDFIHKAFYEIVAADSEVDKLMKAVPFEPCHGKFFFGYPWDMYEDITYNLRYTLYDVVALDSCLRAEIQAPLRLRNFFEEEFLSIGKECGQVFRLLGQSIKTMRHVPCLESMQRAEEGALLLQHKIAKYTSTLIDGGDLFLTASAVTDAPRDGSGVNSTCPSQDDCTGLPLSPHQLNLKDPPLTGFHSNNTDLNNVNQLKSNSHFASGHEDREHKQDLVGHHQDIVAQRISALSLIKFASLLIELVAKAKYVATIVTELEDKACFDEYEDEKAPITSPTARCQEV